MVFHKVDHPYNFLFTLDSSESEGSKHSAEHQTTFSGKQERVMIDAHLPSGEILKVRLEDQGSDVFRYRVTSEKRWPQGNPSQAVLGTDSFELEKSQIRGHVLGDGRVFFHKDGQELLRGLQGQGLGLNGSKWMLCYPWQEDLRFYGMGEKKGFERTGVRTKFWNTDVMADFRGNVIDTGDTDPMYVSLPVLLVRLPGNDGKAGGYFGVVVNNPDGVFMNTAAEEGIFAFQNLAPDPVWYLGSVNWEPDVFFLFAPDMPSLVRKIQELQGKTPMPPLWALGHHQSRWGYKDLTDIQTIQEKFQEHDIPNDGVWLDIQYMRGYRVFTLEPGAFEKCKSSLDELKSKGTRVVPILDPGIKVDPQWDLFIDGKNNNVYCKNTEGEDYIGFVWPGITAYPDFSLGDVRNWWAKKVQGFTAQGFSGYWIDMNDPSTGSSPLEDMRFDLGTLDHGAYHNQYALGMASATRRGLELALEGERPFVLSRSGYLSSSRYTALWTGDNLSNVHHLRNSIGLSLSLSLSGVPFNGPDVPGFAGDASDDLMRAWYKAAFLFPFLRNHNVLNARDQEPWSRDNKTLEIVTEYIRLRYKLLPYLYNLFIDQAELGNPIMRPLVYEYDEEAHSRIDDQFFIGGDIMMAPVLEESPGSRKVRIPEGAWFSVIQDAWIDGSREISVETKAETTPIFLRDGSVIPMQTGIRVNNQNNLGEVEFLISLQTNSEKETCFRYRFDDGLSLGYLDGKRSEVEIRVIAGKIPEVKISGRRMGFGSLKTSLIFLGSFREIQLDIDGVKANVKLERDSLRFAGRNLRVSRSTLRIVGEK